MKEITNTLQILLFREGSNWVAQCLEYDVTAQGLEVIPTVERLGLILTSKVNMDVSMGREPLSACPPAPDIYHKMAKRAKPQSPIPLQLPKSLPSPQFLMVFDKGQKPSPTLFKRGLRKIRKRSSIGPICSKGGKD